MTSIEEYVEVNKTILKAKINMMNKKPKLVVIQIGDNQASNSYIKGKKKDCEEVGIEFELMKFNEIITQSVLNDIVNVLNKDAGVTGIIIQLPIPKHLNVTNIIADEKDVDGFNKSSNFIPCTPLGIVNWLEYNNIDLKGKVCTVIGRSEIVGKPLVNLLMDRGATVISCNSHTENIKEYTMKSDFVFSAIGKPKYFSYYMFNTNAIIIDIGINRDEYNRLCGDIDYINTKNYVKYITPVPKGVGLLTRLALLQNIFKGEIVK